MNQAVEENRKIVLVPEPRWVSFVQYSAPSWGPAPGVKGRSDGPPEFTVDLSAIS
jgi:hypothetical protein